MTPSPSKRRRPLHRQFIRLLLAPLVLAFLVASLVTALIGYQSQKNQKATERQQILDIYSRSLSKPLWDCDSSTAQGIVNTLAHVPLVIGVQLHDVCAGSFIVAGSSVIHSSDQTLQAPVRYQDPLGRTFEVGQLSVRFLPPSIMGSVLQTLWRHSAIFLAMLAAMLTGAIWVFRTIIGRPLHRLLSAIHTQRPVPTPEGEPAARTDELSDVVNAYNALVADNTRHTRALADAINRLQANERQLMHMARHDPLTGLGNRVVLEEVLERAVHRALRSGQGGHVLLLDLNRFKPINDTLGHAMGDQVLKEVAARLKASVRTTDTVVRLGGDEFVVIFEDQVDSADLPLLMDKIRSAIAMPMQLQGHTLQVGASLGAASFPQDATTSVALLAQADQAMYAAKSANARSVQEDAVSTPI